jgi:hypothetical protein
VPALRGALHDELAAVRVAAARALWLVGGKGEEQARRIVPVLAGVLRAPEAGVTVRVAAAETLAGLGAPARPVMPALFEVRQAAVEPALVRAAEAALKKLAAPARP